MKPRISMIDEDDNNAFGIAWTLACIGAGVVSLWPTEDEMKGVKPEAGGEHRAPTRDSDDAGVT